jgi:hypothetical protein
MARSRSTMLIAIGLAVFVVGSALAFLALRNDDDGDNVAASNQQAATVAPAAQSTTAQAAQVPVFKIPDGKEAVAVQLPGVPGVAGYVKAGDRVNVYGTFKTAQVPATPKPPAAKLVLKNVEVLSVTAPAPGVEGGNATYLLALSAEDAERVIYMASFESMWLSLVKDGAPAVGNTPGRTATNLL